MRPALITLSRNRESQQTTTTTPPARVPRQQRLPLQNRDHNAFVMRAAKPLSTRSGNAMPYDKQTLNGSTRPILGGAVKPANKTPLTPRIAGSKAPATPRARQDGPATPSHREGISTPVSTFLANNITPRSSSRKSRVDSEHNTPTSSPTHEQPLRVSADTPVYNGGLGISDLELGHSDRGPVFGSPAASDFGGQRDQSQLQSQSTNDSKFFFASDAKTAAQPSRRPPLSSKTSTSTFVYANGDTIAPPVGSSGSAVGSSMGDDRSNPKFFQPPVYLPPPSSTVSTSSHATSPRFAAQNASNSPSINQRPCSPQKILDEVSFSSLKGISTLQSPVPGRPAYNTQQPTGPVVRKVVVKTPPRTNDREQVAIVGNLTAMPPLQSSLGIVIPGAISTTSSPDVSSADCCRVPAESSEETLSNDDLNSDMPNPIKAEQTLERMNELAANARRERKVLDLEITNSSLAAINRTLEREMRKQNAELRRFRRLSRSGRLSIVAPRASTGGFSTTDAGNATQLSDMSEEEEEEEDSSEDESADEGSLSPRAMAESDARHQERDELRLQLDLSKHQQLLIDSQKMNQSLKRCLEWTEQLIKDGKKALAYHVYVSDIKLGGRVLAPDEDEENGLQPQHPQEGLSEIEADSLGQDPIDETIYGGWGSLNKDNRDSGIDVFVHGARTADHTEEEKQLPP